MRYRETDRERERLNNFNSQTVVVASTERLVISFGSRVLAASTCVVATVFGVSRAPVFLAKKAKRKQQKQLQNRNGHAGRARQSPSLHFHHPLTHPAKKERETMKQFSHLCFGASPSLIAFKVGRDNQAIRPSTPYQSGHRSLLLSSLAIWKFYWWIYF